MNIVTLKRYMKSVARLPIHQVIAKVFGKIRKIAFEKIARRRDFRTETYGCGHYRNVGAALLCRFSGEGLGASMPHTTLAAITALYLDHRFDLLGSGWVHVRHGMECNGLETYRYPAVKAPVFDSVGDWLRHRISASNLSYSQYVWSLIGDGYSPIDWHIDFKSGYRWQEQMWYRDIRFGHLPGVDVKVPWELARMQHLPQLAQAYAAAVNGKEEFAPSDIYLKEFRHQVLDFIALNPPRFGVNWVCSMDVGIRVANCLLAYDLFVSAGAVFDEDFDKVFRLSVYQHGRHIVNNLEWHPVYRGNHYLADIVGLLFVSSYLASDPEVDAWLAFGVQELITEVDFQFYSDGSNFEASTSYHRLSAELAVYATALVLGLPEAKRAALNKYDCRLVTGTPLLNPAPITLFPVAGADIESPFPDWYWERLVRMGDFTAAITRPDGLCPQIGDNDSGRLFKNSPRYQLITLEDAKHRYKNLANYHEVLKYGKYWLEETNSHMHLLEAINGLCNCTTQSVVSNTAVDQKIIEMLARGFKVSLPTRDMSGEVSPMNADTVLPDYLISPDIQVYQFEMSCAEYGAVNLREKLQLFSYPEFGVYLYKSDALYLLFRCGSIGLNGLGAHSHNDPLSIELWIQGQAIIVDPGTYVYTALPDRRNEFRSICAHFSPRVNQLESGSLDMDVFQLGDEANSTCIEFSEARIAGRYQLGVGAIYRLINVSNGAVKIVDWTNGIQEKLARLEPYKKHQSVAYGWISDGNNLK